MPAEPNPPPGAASADAGLGAPARRPPDDRPFSRSPVTLDDLLGGLLWPKLLRTAALALSPGRLGLCAFLIVAVFALDTTWRTLFGGREPGPLLSCLADLRLPAGRLFDALLPHLHAGTWVWTPDLGAAGRAVLDLFVSVPKGMIVTPEGSVVGGVFATIVLLPTGLVLLAIVGGAVCRSVAVEFATGRAIPWTRAVAFSLSRWGSLVGALVGPLVVVWGVCLALVAAGWLMKWPVLNILGGLLYPLMLMLALVAALVMAAYVLGHMMLLPAVACDGADGFDAVQRAYAYAFGQPLRLVAYSLILAVQGVVAFLLLASFIWLGIALTEQTTGFAAADAASGGAWLEGQTRWLIRLWNTAVRIIAVSYALSLYFAGSTVLYLLMRRLNDDQDPRDIWMPGLVEGAAPLAPVPARVPPAPGAPHA